MSKPKDHLGSIPEYQTKWEQLIRSTEPVDKTKAETLINQIYKELGRATPQIIWVDSPWNPIVRTNKIYEGELLLSSDTFNKFEQRIIDLPLRRLGLTKGWRNLSNIRGITLTAGASPEQIENWEGFPTFSFNEATHGLNRLMWPGTHNAFYSGGYETLAFFDWCRNEVGFIHETEPAVSAIELAQTVPWWRPHGTMCFVSERPTKLTFNNPDGPAIAWGPKEWFMIDRVEVPEYVVTRPERITRTDIIEERNAEVRRIMMNRYKSGISDFLKDANATRRDHDERYGTLWRIPERKGRGIDGWFMFPEMFYLEVVNRTPEPDGSFKHYFLRMPPFIDTGKVDSNNRPITRWLNTAKEAYDWSFWGNPVSSSEMTES